MAQILGGLITYLLLAIYCQEQHHEKVSLNRVRELRINIRNELAQILDDNEEREGPDSLSDLGLGPPSHANS